MKRPTAEDYYLASSNVLEKNREANRLLYRLANKGNVYPKDVRTTEELIRLSDKTGLSETERKINESILHGRALESKVASFLPSPGQVDMQQAMMGSLMKDTPEGHYQNAIAKARGEGEILRANYTKAFNSLQEEAKNSFGKVLQANPELEAPETIGEAQKYHDVLTRYAPSLAVDPTVAGSFIKKSINYGGIDEKGVSDLIKTNLDAMKHHSNLERW